ncbi:MAG: FliH/SctL family protein [Polyangiaceae bacterium]
MSIRRGRLLRAEQAGGALPLAFAPTARVATGRRVPAPVVDAELRARAIIADAEARARALLEAAARAAGDARLTAEAEGRADGIAAVAAKAVELRALEANLDERALDRSVELARILAERLLGAELELDPNRVVDLARRALGEAGGARRVRIIAHPDDVRRLEAERESLGAALAVLEILPDPNRAAGNLRLETEIGVLDAALAPQLDRLARRLRESMKK